MRLTNRLLLGALAVVGVHVLVMVFLVNRQLGGRLQRETVEGLAREARVVSAHWRRGVDPEALARADGAALGHRVTLIQPDGTVVGDTDFDPEGLTHLENHKDRPEVMAARNGQVGVSTRPSPSRGDQEVYVAIGRADGVVRVSMSAFSLTSAIADAQRAVTAAGVVALIVALGVAWTLSRALTRPLVELRDVAARHRRGRPHAPRLARRRGGTGRPRALAAGAVGAARGARSRSRHAYEALLLQLTESLNEGVVGVDPSRMVIRINETGRSLFGVREPLPFSADLIPRDRALRDALEEAFAGQVTEGKEAILNGRTVNVTARPLDSGGAVLALLDLTRIRRLEAVRRDFVANVSHELRTPLTVVGGFAETLVHDDPPADRRRQFAQRILGNTRRMQRIVDDLLDLSRIESGGWVPNPEAVDLNAIATDVVAAERDTAAAKGLTIERDIHPDASVAWADATAIRQILMNFVENALRYTTSGRVVVFSRAAERGGIEIGVRDTGSGIPPEHLPRIFERFYRVDPGRSREEGGTGLGLAIVKHLVETHGGHVRAESTVGAGTTIAATFPARPAAGEPALPRLALAR